VGAASDVAPGGHHLPVHHRQVDELWLGRYRRWVYASGFGWQIGAGVVTYVMTAAVYLVVVLGGLSAGPAAAVGLATLFGLVRGLALLAAGGLTSPEALHRFHRRFDAWGPVSRLGVIVVELGVAVVAALAVGPVPAALAVVATVALLAQALRTARRTTPSAVSSPTS
jgi:hypothetical protein